jgi:glycine betaine/choline ABC-type transport system substrate-binding protein
MSSNPRVRALIAALLALALVFGVTACGDDDDDDGDGGNGGAQVIESNPDNGDITITVGSKNFTEQFILGEIYAQALDAAGYRVEKDLNLGSEQIALESLRNGEIDAYPEYTSTALTSFFEAAPEDVPADGQQAFEESEDDFAQLDLTAFPPTEFSSANAVGMLRSQAEQQGVETISDLEGEAQNLTLFGSPECRQRIDCLLGLQQNYGLQFDKFTPVDIGLRYEVLDNGQADLSIVFTTDAQLATSDKYVILEDDQQVLPAGNVLFVARQQTVDEAGPDFGDTVELVQEGLTLPVMQELNARVDIDKETPERVASDYLQEAGYVE